jgi:hypothetical protein
MGEQLIFQGIKTPMRRYLDMGPIIKSSSTQAAVVNLKPQRLDQRKGELECCTSSSDVSSIRRNSRFKQGNPQWGFWIDDAHGTG